MQKETSFKNQFKKINISSKLSSNTKDDVWKLAVPVFCTILVIHSSLKSSKEQEERRVFKFTKYNIAV